MSAVAPSRRLLRRAIPVVGVAAMALVATAACVQILGIEQLPTAVGASDAAQETTVTADAGACSRFDKDPCRPGCPHAFCDDFESEPVGARWVPYLGLAQPYVRGEGGVQRIVDGRLDAGVLTSCLTASMTCIAGLTHVYRAPIDGGVRARGYELTADVRLIARERSDANTEPDLTQALALLAGEGSPAGVVLSSTDGDFYMASVRDLLIDRSLLDPRNLTDPFPSAQGTWLRISLFVGESAAAASAGYRGCPATGAVFAVRIDPLTQACRAADSSEAGVPFDLEAFLASPLVMVGVSSLQAGSATTAYDNVQLDAIP